ncbi:hypothetical protein ACQPW3_26045 [Actinosynnema sp. CA-248983]
MAPAAYGAAVESDVPPAHLTKADGSPLGRGFVAVSSPTSGAA